MSNSSPAASGPRPFAGVACAEIASSPVSWLWEPYLARGKLAVLDGDPGTGKSFVTVDLAARVSVGAPMPGGKAGANPASVLLLNAEDDARDTIRPRVVAAGGDLGRVRVFAAPGIGLERVPRFPDDLDALEAAIRETQAALVVIDPMAAFFAPGALAGGNQSVFLALSPLSALAARTGACVLLVRHLRKTYDANALYRGLGSIAVMGAVRTGLMVARHPDDAELRVLTLAKTNIGPPAASFGFRLARKGPAAQTVVDWAGPVDVSADDLLGGAASARAGRRARERAAEWLLKFLADGKRRVPEVYAAARAAGIPERTLDRAKAAVGVRSDAVNANGKTEWWWRDPEADHARFVATLPPLPELGPLDFERDALQRVGRMADRRRAQSAKPPASKPAPGAKPPRPADGSGDSPPG